MTHDPYIHEMQSDEMIPDHIDNQPALDAALDSCNELRESLADSERTVRRLYAVLTQKNRNIAALETAVLRLTLRLAKVEESLEHDEHLRELEDAGNSIEAADVTPF